MPECTTPKQIADSLRQAWEITYPAEQREQWLPHTERRAAYEFVKRQMPGNSVAFYQDVMEKLLDG